jgi:hypothetical protein
MTKKIRRRPVQSNDLANLQQLLDQAAARDATAEANTTPNETETKS